MLRPVDTKALMKTVFALALTVCLAACGAPGTPDGRTDAGLPGAGSSDAGVADAGAPDAGSIDAGSIDAGDPGRGLPVLFFADAGAAARGESLLLDGGLGAGLVPLVAMRNLWVVWGGGPPASDAVYWASFGERYGLFEGPGVLPLGLKVTASQEVSLDCLTCHASVLEGQLVIGAPNVRFDLQGLYDDLVRLSQLAPMFGFPSTPPPFTISGRTQAKGLNDAMGLGLALASRWAPGTTIDDTQGFQRPPAWWTLKHKPWHYTDGSGPVGGYRTMMATLLASRMTLSELQAKDAQFADLGQYLLSLEPPRWPFAAADAALVAQGRALFNASCASCHGTYDGPARSFPSFVGDVGTDATRATSFGPAEAAFINSSWFGADAPMRSTGGYLAPDLTGVWATAPYLHNGSVPTLAALLDSSARPASFRLSTTWDAVAVGWQFTVAPAAGQATLEARKTYDTLAPGLSKSGHTMGDALTPAERTAVVEYLKTL